MSHDHRNEEREDCRRQAALNLAAHEESVAQSHAALLAQGVPERYICVLQSEGAELVNLIFHARTTELASAMSECARILFASAAAFRCVDLRDRAALVKARGRYAWPGDSALEELLAEAEGRALSFSRADQPGAYVAQCLRNRERRESAIREGREALRAQGVPDERIGVRWWRDGLACELVRLQARGVLEALHAQCEKEPLCHYPDVTRCTCVDLCEHGLEL